MELKGHTIVLRVAHNEIAFNTTADALTNYKQLLADNIIYLCDIKRLPCSDYNLTQITILLVQSVPVNKLL